MGAGSNLAALGLLFSGLAGHQLPDIIAIWEGIQLNVEIVYCICKFPCIFDWLDESRLP